MNPIHHFICYRLNCIYCPVLLFLLQRMERFGNGRNHVFYDEKLQLAHHIHFPADGEHRVLQHHYAFAFFANPDMQSFYRRFVRDYMRYRDEIQCAGAELVAAVRADSLKTNPSEGSYIHALFSSLCLVFLY